MHALRRFLEDGVRRRRWNQADLARESGISKQVVSNLLGDERPTLDRLPQDKTIDGIARALEVDRSVVLAVIAQAMGLPVSEPTVVYDPSGVGDADLLRELARRLDERVPAGRAGAPGAVVPLAVAPDVRDVPHDRPVPLTEAWAARTGEPDPRLGGLLGESGDDGGDGPVGADAPGTPRR